MNDKTPCVPYYFSDGSLVDDITTERINQQNRELNGKPALHFVDGRMVCPGIEHCTVIVDQLRAD